MAYVSGFEENLYFFSRLPKPPNFHQDLQTICNLKTSAIETAIRDTETQIASARDSRELLQAHQTAAQLYAYRGDIDQSIHHFEAALNAAVNGGSESQVRAVREKLGIVWLRKGELDNCVSNHNARSCIFPLTAEARHKMQTGSRNALKLFVEYMRDQPDDIEVRWLLNLALQTLGSSKDIPEAYVFLVYSGGAEARERVRGRGALSRPAPDEQRWRKYPRRLR